MPKKSKNAPKKICRNPNPQKIQKTLFKKKSKNPRKKIQKSIKKIEKWSKNVDSKKKKIKTQSILFLRIQGGWSERYKRTNTQTNEKTEILVSNIDFRY